ncbi:hypothetical protein NDU88_001994 [Pleurodeles waltl]|uniref:Uncharacterized protein n=1 Tax=Pleurodeles waltl TaxID=8319 RepID=A0AAV7LD20_PLEWA|nr:hypothetical protein NDU88_001994 [Pleurodeles waltl]
MRHGDPKQCHISFDLARTPRCQGLRGLLALTQLMASTLLHPLEGAAVIMAELKAGFKAIDTDFNALAMWLNGMHKRLGEHSTDDGAMALSKRMERVERLLKTVEANNENLVA